MTTPTFADLLSPTGMVSAAAAITMLVQLVKAVFPLIDARVSGALMAFSASCVLYIATALATTVSTPDQALAVVFAWLGCATASVGIKSAADHVSS